MVAAIVANNTANNTADNIADNTANNTAEAHDSSGINMTAKNRMYLHSVIGRSIVGSQATKQKNLGRPQGVGEGQGGVEGDRRP